LGSSKSQEFEDTNSVSQGSSLGSPLFAIFINEITEAYKGTGVKLKLYADDLVIYFQHASIDSITTTLNSALFLILIDL